MQYEVDINLELRMNLLKHKHLYNTTYLTRLVSKSMFKKQDITPSMGLEFLHTLPPFQPPQLIGKYASPMDGLGAPPGFAKDDCRTSRFWCLC